MCVATTTGVPAPYRMWTLREEYGGRRPGEEDSVWAVFKSHEEVSEHASYFRPLYFGTIFLPRPFLFIFPWTSVLCFFFYLPLSLTWSESVNSAYIWQQHPIPFSLPFLICLGRVVPEVVMCLKSCDIWAVLCGSHVLRTAYDF